MILPALIVGIVGRAVVRYAVGAGARYLAQRGAQAAIRRLMQRAVREGRKRLDDEIERLKRCPRCRQLKDRAAPCHILSRGNPANSGYRGGSYGGTKSPGIESHHIPAESAYPLVNIGQSRMPAIQMDPADHALTASHPRQPGAQAYRDAQKRLIASGNIGAAFAMDVADIKAKFGDKYDEALVEAAAYLACLKYFKKVK